MYIDTHTHIFNRFFSDVHSIIDRALGNNVKIIICGFDESSNKEAIGIANSYKTVFACVGFSPNEANSVSNKTYKDLELQIKEKKVIAIGEIGLDYYWNQDNKDKQKKIFTKQLRLSKKYSLPVVIHSRDATEDVYNILVQEGIKSGVIHCFDGSLEDANRFVAIGMKLGIGGKITYNNKRLIEVVRTIKLSNIVLETDSPYLKPNSLNIRINEPVFILEVAKEVAKIRNQPIEEIEAQTTQNVIELFDKNKQLW